MKLPNHVRQRDCPGPAPPLVRAAIVGRHLRARNTIILLPVLLEYHRLATLAVDGAILRVQDLAAIALVARKARGASVPGAAGEQRIPVPAGKARVRLCHRALDYRTSCANCREHG